MNDLNSKVMRDRMIEINGQTPFIPITIGTDVQRQGIIPNLQGSYWMQVYPPMLYIKAAIPGASQICPWSMIAEVTDDLTLYDRKQQVLDALRSGQHMMSFYDLPSDRILFLEDIVSKEIRVWVD